MSGAPAVRRPADGTAARGETTAERVFDSPDPWVAEHIRRFVETDGAPRPGMNDLLLTTRGRRSGKLRRTALAYVPDKAGGGAGVYLLTASDAGADRHPAWYLNLVHDPGVTLQVGADVFAADARVATPGERPRLWRMIVSAMPSYQRYQEATDREIPVVIVERRAAGAACDGAPAGGGRPLRAVPGRRHSHTRPNPPATSGR